MRRHLHPEPDLGVSAIDDVIALSSAILAERATRAKLMAEADASDRRVHELEAQLASMLRGNVAEVAAPSPQSGDAAEDEAEDEAGGEDDDDNMDPMVTNETLASRIIAHLDAFPSQSFTAVEIARATDWANVPSIRTMLGNMAKRRVIRKVGFGKYASRNTTLEVVAV